MSIDNDPDGMNEQRTAWAQETLVYFSGLTGCDWQSEALGDLLTNLHHWAARNGVDLAKKFEGARRNYETETGQ